MGGLCGNYDHNSKNDFVTRGGMETSDRLVMAESWQGGQCRDPTSVDEVDGCRGNPTRKAWAEARCSVLKNKFADCHSHVDHNPYYERCVFDTCAQNQGGESESFCTSVAAYAQECNRHGVSPYWRSQDMCPMQCDGYRNYNPCVTACPINCNNFNRKDQIEGACQDSCVEGCSCKGKLIYDKTEGCCIERTDCVCMIHEGIAYGEGDKIYSMSDECKSCYCMDNEIHCLGLPCEEGLLPPDLPTTIDYWSRPITSGQRYNPFLNPSEEECAYYIGMSRDQCPPHYLNECGYTCAGICHSWRAAQYECIHGSDDTCCMTCGDEVALCPAGQVLRDENTCVSPQDCTCLLKNGDLLAPGDSWEEKSSCTKYYCWNNVLETSEISGCVPEIPCGEYDYGYYHDTIININKDGDDEGDHHYSIYSDHHYDYDSQPCDGIEYYADHSYYFDEPCDGTITVGDCFGTLNILTGLLPCPQYSDDDCYTYFDYDCHSDIVVEDCFPYEIIQEHVYCGAYAYGDVWTCEDDHSLCCTCYDVDDIRCEPIVCDPQPLCSFGQRLVTEYTDAYCPVYRCVEETCDESKCYAAPTCQYYENLEMQTFDGCCATYSCKCDHSKCMELGDAKCPEGSVRMEIDPEACCPVGKCVKMEDDPCAGGLSIYMYNGDDSSDDYCGGYGYLNCNSYVDSDYCYGDYHNYGHGTYLNHYCDGHGDGSSYFSVYSPCYGYGYGYPCGGIEVGHGHNGYYGNYGYDSSSSCGDGLYFYDYDYCGDSDDYCGGYGYLNCNSYVDSDYCHRNYYNYGHGTYLNHYCDGEGDDSSSFSVYSPCY